MRRNGSAPRVVLLCSAAFFCLCALCTVLLRFGLWTALAACGAAAFLLSGAALLTDSRALRACAAGLLAALVCCCVHGLTSWRPAWALDGRTGVCRVAVSDDPDGYDRYGVVWGRLLTLEGARTDVRVKVYLRDGSPDCAPGDLLSFEGSVRASDTALSRGLLQRGVFLTVRQTGALTRTDNGASTALTRLRRLAATMRARIGTMLGGDEGGLLAAMLTGDDRGCSDGLLRALSATGLRHVTAVSGLHLTILAAFLIRLLGKRAGAWLALPVVFTFAALAGFPASAVRAAVMQSFLLAAFLLRRESDGATALGASLLLLCAVNPCASLSAGLLLSFSATAGLLACAAPLAQRLSARKISNGPLRRARNALAGGASVSLCATACTLPVTLLWFGSASLVSLPMNLLCLWAVSLSLLLGVAALTLTALVPAAAPVCGAVLRVPLRYLTALITGVGSRPWASARASLYWAFACAALLLLLALLRKGRLRALPVCASVLCLCVALSALETRLVTRIAVSDAGGSPVLVLRDGGETAVVGTGNNGFEAAQFIRAELERAGSGESAFLLSCVPRPTDAGAARSAANARTLLLPAGAAAGDFDGAMWYTGSGETALGGLTVSLLRAGDAALCRIAGAGPAVLSLCGAEPWVANAALAETPLTAAVVLIDRPWVDAPEALSRVCARCGARVLLLFGAEGLPDVPTGLCGLPLYAPDTLGTVTLESMR